MLTSLLRSNTILGILLGWASIFTIVAVSLFTNAHDTGLNDMLYGHWFFRSFEGLEQLLPWFTLVVLVAMLLLIRVRTRETKSVLGESTLMTLAFVSIVMTQPRVVISRPDLLVGMLFVCTAFLLLLYTYKREKALSELFHAGLLIGIASLFWGQSIVMLIPFAFGLLMLRTGNWREWVVLFFGLIMLAVFVMLFSVWQEFPFVGFQNTLRSSWMGTISQGRYTFGHYAIALAAVVSMGGQLTAGTSTVAERNIVITNAGWLMAVVLMVLMFGLSWHVGLVMAAFPLSSFMARSLESINRWWLADLLLLTILSAPFLSSLWPL